MELVWWGLQAGRDSVGDVNQGFCQLSLSFDTCKKKKKNLGSDSRISSTAYCGSVVSCAMGRH